MCIVCHGLFALPLGVAGRPLPVIVAFPGHLLYYSVSISVAQAGYFKRKELAGSSNYLNWEICII